jgi:hypothetical protein
MWVIILCVCDVQNDPLMMKKKGLKKLAIPMADNLDVIDIEFGLHP